MRRRTKPTTVDQYEVWCAVLYLLRTGNCRDLLAQKILPLVRYFAYLQVAQEEQSLWLEYEQLRESHANFAMRKVSQANEIYPVFHDLFKKAGVDT